MKKLIALLLALVMVLALAACAPANEGSETTTGSEEAVKVMSYAEYAAAELDSAVVVECYVQNHQSWWDNKITVYAQDEDGAYFLYELACAEEDADKLVPGTKIRVKGTKSAWSGEVEIMDGSFEIIEGETWIAEALDITEKLADENLIDYQNQLIAVKGAEIEKIEYKNGEPGDDIYLTVGVGGESYSFCVEVYLTGTNSDVYTTVGELAEGDKVDIEGFLYWYEGPNPHITAIQIAE